MAGSGGSHHMERFQPPVAAHSAGRFEAGDLMSLGRSGGRVDMDYGCLRDGLGSRTNYGYRGRHEIGSSVQDEFSHLDLSLRL